MHINSSHLGITALPASYALRAALFASVLSLPLSAAASFQKCPDHFPNATPPNLQPLPAGWGLRELCYSEFALVHAAATRTPLVVIERLDPARVRAAKDGARTDKFFPDARLPHGERAELADYAGSGYDRGHMAPAGDMATQEGMAQSFSLANMVPQAPIHNRKTWRKIESDTRAYVKRSGSVVYVFSGPSWQGNELKTIGAGKVAVPTHLYKLVYDATKNRAWAHWVENSDTARPGKPLSYQELSTKLGYELLPGKQPAR